MPLKKIRATVVEAAAKKGGSGIPVVSVEGDVVTRYNGACRALKDAEAVKDELRPEIEGLALSEYFAVAVANPNNPPGNVKLQDEQGAVVRFDFKNKYGKVDGEAAEALFEEELGVDINLFVQETVTAKFDSSVFLVDGIFSEKVYAAFKKAIDDCANRLKVNSPLSTEKVVMVKPDFHKRRFAEFPSSEQQQRLFEVTKNVVALMPEA